MKELKTSRTGYVHMNNAATLPPTRQMLASDPPNACRNCGQLLTENNGCDDEMPNHCDDCWVGDCEHDNYSTTKEGKLYCKDCDVSLEG